MKLRIAILLSLIFSALPKLVAAGEPAVVILGDSNTWYGGDDCTGPRGWNTWFSRAFPTSSCVSYARSGATWSHTDSTTVDLEENVGHITHNNVTTNQILRLKRAIESGWQSRPDIVLIALGTNDSWFPGHRPHALEPDTTTTLTVAGAARADLRLLHSFLPDSRIVVLTPIRSSKIDDERTTAVAEILKQASTDCGVDWIDLQKLSPIQSTDPDAMRRYTIDGVHTSQEGARRNGEIVARELTEMLER